MDLRDLHIGPRLGLGFGVILVAFVATVATGVISGNRQREALAHTLQHVAAQQALAADMREALLSSAVAMRNMGLQTEVDAVQKDEAQARLHRSAYLAARKKLEASELKPVEQQAFKRLADIDSRMQKQFDEAVGLASQFNTEQAAKLITQQIDPLLNQASAELTAFVNLQKQHSAAAALQADAANRDTLLAMAAASTLVMLVAALLAWRITLSITQPMGWALQASGRVERGDLVTAIDSVGDDEAARLLKGLAQMRDGLSHIVGEVRAGAENISTGAREIAAGNVELSQRTEAQAANLEQTAASIEQINATVKNNAATANRANQVASAASVSAGRGGEVMTQVVSTMADIRSSSARIADIIGLIDGIAFQTNILALNAAVEAARAGEQGRGFAVVATEVRSLAGRSAAAAREIKSLIAASVERVEAGGHLVATAGASMEELVTQVGEVATLIGELSSSANEQTSGIGQINQAIAQLDHVTQQNASLVEQAAAAAESLNQQAAGMVAAVSVFKLA
ncbi:MAG: MCP four helix bundle domain-containing protein [Rubrivivax sp.]|nr:MCP four helix bundle domain-containing protein [Rubrivivax sp.]